MTPHRFLPTSRADLDARGWTEVDIVIVSGDAYVDHPAFGPVLIARFLEGRGFKVGFTPRGVGTRSATLTLTDDTADGSTTFNLKGKGNSILEVVSLSG